MKVFERAEKMADWRVAKWAVNKVGRLVGASVDGSVDGSVAMSVAWRVYEKAARSVSLLVGVKAVTRVCWTVLRLAASKATR